MSKHTPGPWKFNGKYIYAECVGDFYGYQVSIVNHDMSDFPQEEIVANGILSAAAPDLLEALETIKRRMYEPRALMLEEVESMIDKVIAKAKGE